MGYLHHIPGRIRVRARGARRNAARSLELERRLQSITDVDRAEVNPLTGRALIHYRGPVANGNQIIGLMREQGWLEDAASGSIDFPVERRLVRAVLGYLAEAAIERSLLALAAAIL